jgi:hypothetical protein
MTNTPPGHITKKGYRRITINGRLVMEHVHTWTAANGPIPHGYDVHHHDHDKLNNDLSNLRLVTKLEHKRIHSGCELRDGQWWKPCKVCGQMKPATPEHWYFSRGWINGQVCKPCFIRKVVREKQLRRAFARQG